MLRSNNETTAAVMSLLEELMPLLALEPGTCGIQSQCDRISEYLSPLAQALEARIRDDSTLDVDVPNGGPMSQAMPVPVLGCLSTHILALITRYVSDVILQSVLIDEVVCSPAIIACMDLHGKQAAIFLGMHGCGQRAGGQLWPPALLDNAC